MRTISRIAIVSVIAVVFGTSMFSQERAITSSRPHRAPLQFELTRLPADLDPGFEKLFIGCRIDIVLGTDVLLEPGAFAQHDCRLQSPRFR